MPDFLSLLRAIEHLVYEVMVWLLFLPLTLAKVVFRPDLMIKFVISEYEKPEEDAYSSAMRPVAFLVISLLLGLILVPLTKEELDILRQSSPIGPALADNPLFLIAFRTLVFGYFPMSGAIVMDLATPGKVDRNSLKLPFSLHCYIFAPFALVCSPALVMLSRGDVSMIAIISAAHCWLFASLVTLYRVSGFKIFSSVLFSVLVYLMGFSLNFLLLSGI